MPLIILKELLLVALLEVVCHCVRPFKCHAALLNFVDSLLHKLDLDPRQIRGDLHLFHLLLGLVV